MSQSQVQKLIPKLRFNVHERRKLSQPDGPKGRHDKIRKIVTALFKHERLETLYSLGDESRGYAERLISDAIKYGDCHTKTMEMASYWLTEKQLVHKLFKVLAPRYQNYPFSYTKLWRAPINYPSHGRSLCVLELRENIYPPLGPDKTNHKNLIHNVLLNAAKEAYLKEKALKLKKQEIDPKIKLDETNAKLNVEINSGKVEMSKVDLQKEEDKKTSEESKRTTEAESTAVEEDRISIEEDRTTTESRKTDKLKRKPDEESKRGVQEDSKFFEEDGKIIEESRAIAEDSRKSALENKELVEESRKPVEESKKAAEEGRVIAEESRKPIHESRKTAEEGRIIGEESRKPLHESRKTAEESKREPETDKTTSDEGKVIENSKKDSKKVEYKIDKATITFDVSDKRESRYSDARTLKRSVASVDLSGNKELASLRRSPEVADSDSEGRSIKSEEEKKQK